MPRRAELLEAAEHRDDCLSHRLIWGHHDPVVLVVVQTDRKALPQFAFGCLVFQPGGQTGFDQATDPTRGSDGNPGNAALSRVTQRWVVAHDENVVALTFAAADGKSLPRWFPGAHIDIHLPSGRLRQYSLCGNAEVTDSYRIAVRRIPDGGGGSIEVHDELAVGAAVTTGGPRNAFPLSISGYG